MQPYLRSRVKSFQFAISGWRYVLKTQPNARIHAVVTIFVFLLAFLLQCSLLEWGILILTTALVWVAEFINTAIEATIDLVSPQMNPLAKISKDVSAAAVLLAALAAVIIGIIIFAPPLVQRLSGIFN